MRSIVVPFLLVSFACSFGEPLYSVGDLVAVPHDAGVPVPAPDSGIIVIDTRLVDDGLSRERLEEAISIWYDHGLVFVEGNEGVVVLTVDWCTTGIMIDSLLDTTPEILVGDYAFPSNVPCQVAGYLGYAHGMGFLREEEGLLSYNGASRALYPCPWTPADAEELCRVIGICELP